MTAAQPMARPRLRPRPAPLPVADVQPSKFKMNGSGTSLDRLAVSASLIIFELESKHRRPKLTPGAFINEAMRIGNTDIQRIGKLEEVLAQQVSGSGSIRAWIRTLSKLFLESFSEPHPDIPKMARSYGSQDLLAELNSLNFSLGDAYALASQHAANLDPDRFGNCESHEQLIDKPNRLRAKLNSIYDEMRSACTLADLLIDESIASPSERDRGLVHISFRRAPSHWEWERTEASDQPQKVLRRGVLLNSPDWPEQLARNALAEPESKEETTDERH
jgi:hypothetical protein